MRHGESAPLLSDFAWVFALIPVSDAMGRATLPSFPRYPAPRQNGHVWTNTVSVSPGSRDSIFRRDRRPAAPNRLDLPSLQRVPPPAEGVTLDSWPMIDISVGIGDTKKRHSIDGPDRS